METQKEPRLIANRFDNPLQWAMLRACDGEPGYFVGQVYAQNTLRGNSRDSRWNAFNIVCVRSLEEAIKTAKEWAQEYWSGRDADFHYDEASQKWYTNCQFQAEDEAGEDLIEPLFLGGDEVDWLDWLDCGDYSITYGAPNDFEYTGFADDSE